MERIKLLLAAVLVTLLVATAPSVALAQSKPNIVFIMGDDIGMWNISAYHRGLMAGRTPNIDRLAAEGALFTGQAGRQSRAGANDDSTRRCA
jgi:hypothetical protein